MESIPFRCIDCVFGKTGIDACINDLSSRYGEKVAGEGCEVGRRFEYNTGEPKAYDGADVKEVRWTLIRVSGHAQYIVAECPGCGGWGVLDRGLDPATGRTLVRVGHFRGGACWQGWLKLKDWKNWEELGYFTLSAA